MNTFPHLVELSRADLGARVISATDRFFAGPDELLSPEPAVFDPDAYTDRGKLMDGWEPRRRRMRGHQVAIIELAVPGALEGVDIDTSHFLGNHAPFASLDGGDGTEWEEILPQVPLNRGCSNVFAVKPGTYSHVRLHMVPAGGIARLRVYGSPRKPRVGKDPYDLAGLLNGAQALGCSDMFFSPMSNLLLPMGPANMGEGWETRRSRPPGKDFVIVRLSDPGELESIELHTTHFKGNFPDRAAIDGVCWPGADPWALMTSEDWRPVVPMSPLGPDRRHAFKPSTGPWTHLRMRIEPDGGVARLRAWGLAAQPETFELDLAGVSGSERWSRTMSGPWTSLEHLLGEAERQWWRLNRADQLESFAAHPRIGADIDALKAKYRGRAASEQAGVTGASDEVLEALARANIDYEARFGHIFLVCASGKSAEEMLAILKRRVENDADLEFQVACAEEAKIMRLRIDKLLEKR